MTNTEREVRAEWRRLRAEHQPKLNHCSFKVNGRFTRKLGVCRSRAGVPISVEIAKSLVMNPALRAQAMDTLYHEVAHALAGHEHGHGPAWKAWCVKLGADPKRLADLTTDEKVAMEQVNPSKWDVECLGCGHTFTRNRVSPRTLAVATHGGTGCGGFLRFTDKITGRVYESAKPRMLDEAFDPSNPFGW